MMDMGMSSDELMKKGWELSNLLSILREQFPKGLPDTTKKKLVRQSPEEIT